MRSVLKKLFVSVAIAVTMIIMLVALFLAYSTIIHFSPAATEPAIIFAESGTDSIPAGEVTIYFWNIGYCGLGKEMDFFYEGGTMVRPEEKFYQRYRKGVIKQLSGLGKPDFILLQEVNRDSKRNYGDDQVKLFSDVFSGYESNFAINYKAAFVPIPILEPVGRVLGGVMTLSKYKSTEAIRYAFPSCYSWPKQLFMLKRCFVLTRYPVKGGKQLVMINTHNSAFDDAAEMRAQEIALLKSTMEAEYKRGF